MEQLQQFYEYVQLNWLQIVEYVVMVIAYFLIALFRSKVGSTRRDLTVMFKEKAQEVKNTDIALRNDVGIERKAMQKELAESKAAYKAAIDAIKNINERLCRTEDALAVITDTTVDDLEVIEEVENNAELHSDETD
jgi:hypothetical protein